MLLFGTTVCCRQTDPFFMLWKTIGLEEKCPGKMLRWRCYAKEEASGEAKGREETYETRGICGHPTGSVSLVVAILMKQIHKSQSAVMCAYSSCGSRSSRVCIYVVKSPTAESFYHPCSDPFSQGGTMSTIPTYQAPRALLSPLTQLEDTS